MEEKICDVEGTIKKDGQNKIMNLSKHKEPVAKMVIKSEPPDMPEVLGIIDILMNDKAESSTSTGKKKKNRNPIIQRRKKIMLSDDEWEPEKKSTTEKPSKEGSSKGTEEYYGYDILNQIEIVTITEEERLAELKEAYESRKHMNYICKGCAAGFVVKDAYDVHMKLHAKESGEFVCEVCNTYMKSEETLHRHKLRHYRRYRCMVCSVRYKDKDAVAGHVSFMHSGNTFNCDQCGSTFKRPQYLRRHIEQIHTKSTPMECPICQQVYYESGWYRNHIRKHNKEVQDSKIVKCPECDRTFKHKSYLKTHMLTHESCEVVCLECSENFRNSHLLEEHYKAAHAVNFTVRPDEDNRCTYCKRPFETRAKMHNHVQRMHVDGGKKYQCDHCKRLYYSKGEVRSHIKWTHLQHAGGHACTCGRVFRTPVRLRDHIATRHLGAVPPRDKHCPHCQKAFANQQVLTRHIKSHAGELFPCTECGREFKTQSYVKVHYQVAHLHMTRAQIRRQNKRKLIMVEDMNPQSPTNEEELYGCNECGKKFKTQSYVRIHYFTKHLNMTHAQAKKKCRELRSITQLPGCSKDPMQIEEVFVKTEPEDAEEPNGIKIPMFETFVDIQRESIV
ncbi:unnamed protein product [Pieris brassicae]|uniref:C2H2-type domain-containing protein n=1 Tax=Pieris brassicae TaxID=7116 RepID=A0A9P0XFC8_PIEBR|nr:unnamed protein product [Pieris brassicae]